MKINDVDVKFFVRFRTLCLSVLLADNQEIIHYVIIKYIAAHNIDHEILTKSQ